MSIRDNIELELYKIYCCYYYFIYLLIIHLFIFILLFYDIRIIQFCTAWFLFFILICGFILHDIMEPVELMNTNTSSDGLLVNNNNDHEGGCQQGDGGGYQGVRSESGEDGDVKILLSNKSFELKSDQSGVDK